MISWFKSFQGSKILLIQQNDQSFQPQLSTLCDAKYWPDVGHSLCVTLTLTHGQTSLKLTLLEEPSKKQTGKGGTLSQMSKQGKGLTNNKSSKNCQNLWKNITPIKNRVKSKQLNIFDNIRLWRSEEEKPLNRSLLRHFG